MIVIVDANILFSALITPAGKLAEILTYPNLPAQIISGHYLLVELNKHHEKIVRYAKRPEADVVEDRHNYIKNIVLYDEAFIEEQHWLEAERLTDRVDHFDVSYVALTIQTGGLLWTGDKKLSTHLKRMGFDDVLNSAELYTMLNIG